MLQSHTQSLRDIPQSQAVVGINCVLALDHSPQCTAAAHTSSLSISFPVPQVGRGPSQQVIGPDLIGLDLGLEYRCVWSRASGAPPALSAAVLCASDTLVREAFLSLKSRHVQVLMRPAADAGYPRGRQVAVL